MRLTLGDLEGLLRKYESEGTPLFAMLEASSCKAAVRGTLRMGVDDEGSQLLLIGVDCAKDFADCIRFPYAPAEWDVNYADLREVQNENVDDLKNKVDGIVTITHKRSKCLIGLYELRRG